MLAVAVGAKWASPNCRVWGGRGGVVLGAGERRARPGRHRGPISRRIFATASGGCCGMRGRTGGVRAGGLDDIGGRVRGGVSGTGGPAKLPAFGVDQGAVAEAWWHRSDPKAERVFRNDLRFERFLGVGLAGRTHGRNTFRRYDACGWPVARDQHSTRGLAEKLLAAVDRQLCVWRLVMQCGSILDATLVRRAAALMPEEVGRMGGCGLRCGSAVRGPRGVRHPHRCHLQGPCFQPAARDNTRQYRTSEDRV